MSQLQVQEAADCLGADCVPRYVEMKKLIELEIEDAFQAKQKVRLFPISMISSKCYMKIFYTVFNFCIYISMNSPLHNNELLRRKITAIYSFE